MRIIKSILLACLLLAAATIFLLPPSVRAQTVEPVTVNAAALGDGKTVALNKAAWKYRSGDDLAWAGRDLDDAAWERLDGSALDPKSLPPSGWSGRGWFRLKIRVDETAANRQLTLVGRQIGASEVYLNGRLLARFGEIRDDGGETEYDPSRLPIPFEFDGAGEHTLAVRYSLSAMKDLSGGSQGAWLAQSGLKPGFNYSLADAPDLRATIQNYKNTASMRIGFLFIGIMAALALVHFLLFAFYRAERANLFYSLYAVAFAVNLVGGNLLTFGHQGLKGTVALILTTTTMSAILFTALLAFLHVAFGRAFDWRFWTIAAVWAISVALNFIFLNSMGYLRIIPGVAIFLSFSFGFFLLVKALRARLRGAWILMAGVQIFAFAMMAVLLTQLKLIAIPPDYFFIVEVALLLGVPLSVSVFLAHNVAFTNRDLSEQLATVERLSAQQIEQEKHAAELRAENERRMKELEEARQLQLSMLPKKLPELPNLQIAAYMKPATEVGGDYYDFHVAEDGTLTVAVGDATGHGLKAGTVVTATKGLFSNLASAPDIADTLKQISRSLKRMNLRGLFMAMTMLKIKGKRLQIGAAGMPSALIYRAATGTVEEISTRALPLGGVTNYAYRQEELELSDGDVVLLMSDGFPEMFNPAGEMLDYGQAAREFQKIAGGARTPQEIINHFTGVAETWAGSRPPDDDVTFVVLKVKGLPPPPTAAAAEENGN